MTAPSRSPCESVDWNFGIRPFIAFLGSSLSLRERGLKLANRRSRQAVYKCRSPCESVDWNCFALSVRTFSVSRSPCESVDWNGLSVSHLCLINCRSPCESVDWNYFFVPFRLLWQQSLSLRERGLKLNTIIALGNGALVALLARAWIEMPLHLLTR